ncbi:hypothetical protein G7046_g1373 [Stylonectria norvegica]|nr:hypothetical protein G7046_g1373 [Stylonectria norvegica]
MVTFPAQQGRDVLSKGRITNDIQASVILVESWRATSGDFTMTALQPRGDAPQQAVIDKDPPKFFYPPPNAIATYS